MAYSGRTKTIIDDMAPMRGTLQDMQLILGVSREEVRRLSNEGVIKKDLRGVYDVLMSIKGYVTYLQGRTGLSRAISADYAEERARLTKAQADKAEMETAVMAGKLVDVEQLTTEWELMLSSMKTKLLAIPSKVAPVVADEDSPGVIQNIIDEFVRESLQELATYGTDAGEREAGADEGAESVDAAPETESKPVGRRRKKA